MKTITICGKEYTISCNAFTRFQYKKVFNKGIFEDLKVLQNFAEKQEKIKAELTEKKCSEEEITQAINSYMMEKFDDFLDVVEKMAYILILTANDKFESFENWLKGIEKIDMSEDWIGEVTEFAVSSFC